MSREPRPLAALALVALISLISAGCGSNASSETGTGSSGGNNTASNASSETGTASSSGSATSAGSASTASTASETAVKFAECMRENGASEFPDPNASGDFADGIKRGSSLDPSTAAWKKAISACKDLEPPGFTGHKRSPEQQKAALEFAQCIRDNGVKDFPDPDPDGPMIDTNRIPSTARDGGMSRLHAAMQKCRDHARGAGVTGEGNR